MKNKKVLVISILVLLVVLTSALILPKINKAYMGETGLVYYPVENIKQGILITENMVKEKEIPKHLILDNAVILKQEIVGQYAKTDIYKSEYFIKEKISNKNETAFYEDKNLIAVSVNKLAQSIAGQIKSGDIVNIYGYSNNDEKLIFEELKKIEVAYKVNAKGVIITDDMEQEDAIPLSIILKVDNITQIKQLLELEYNANIHFERVAMK